MSFWSRLNSQIESVLGLDAAPQPAPVATTPAGIMPSRRLRETDVTAERALTLSTLYRGVQIHATSVSQLSLAVERNGVTLEATPTLVEKPDIDETRSAFLEYTTVSLYIDGNAFWLITRADDGSSRKGEVVNLTAVNPSEVTVKVERDGFGIDKITYHYRGKQYDRRGMAHLKLLRIPGLHRGLGPIQAAQIEVRGALDARDYGALWLSDSNIPDGVLTTDQELPPGAAEKYKHVWYGRNPDGSKRESDAAFGPNEKLRVLGQGLTYSPLLLKPSDVQFLETQQFSTIEMARLIGAPASIMLVAVEGSSETYSNVEQEWIGYVRFGLMKALREIEEAFSDLLPGRQVARFKLDALLRSDTKSRYEAHAISLDPVKGWRTPDEVRALEGDAPLTDAQRAELAGRRATAPTSTPTKEPAQ
ncbi:phage portal protein [Labedella phragmitis]|uniref:Phage portal protein n=1 Tax=Labedella phragmitis TaxID=2498849 RepID=A0A3S3ZD73_9MICO|nr:phage portal protein [Labedella phragmitis]RWZ52932.1 phage portal protein [Labedella phragmitis]